MRTSRSTHIITLTHKSAVAGLCVALVVGIAGCPQRNEIASDVSDTQARIEQSERTPVAIDSTLLTWTELASVPTGMDEPRALALDPNGDLFVAGDSEVRRFDSGGALLARFDVPDEPRAIAVGPDGRMYVASMETLRIFNPDGGLLETWVPPGDNNYLTSVAVTGKTVYVADAGERVVYRVGPDDTAAQRFGEKDEAAGIPGLIVPSAHLDVAVAPDGNLVITNPGRRAVETYSPDGVLLASFGKASADIYGFSGCCNPTDIALLPDGLVVTTEKGRPRVKVCEADGSIESVIATTADFNPAVRGLDLAASPDGRVFVLDPMKRTARVFTRNEALDHE